MAHIRSQYGTSNQPIVITLDSLANDGMRSSTAVENNSTGYLDALVQVRIVSGGAGPSGDMNVLVYAYASADSGVSYSGSATGSDDSYGGSGGQVVDNCPLLGIVGVDAQNETFESDVFSVAGAFGGVMPGRWGIIVRNQTGQTLGTGCSAFYQGVSAQVDE